MKLYVIIIVDINLSSMNKDKPKLKLCEAEVTPIQYHSKFHK